MTSRNKLAALQSANVPIVIFGAGESGEAVAEFLMLNDIVPVAFCDNFVRGEKVIGNRRLPVISVVQLTERFSEAYIVIGAISSVDQICSQLIEVGFSEEQILYFTDIWMLDEAEEIENEQELLNLSMSDSCKYEKRVKIGNEKKALMVAYCFPPVSGSGVYRSLKFAKYLPSVGWEPTVISAALPPKYWNYRDDSLLKEIPDSIHCVRVVDELPDGAFSIFHVPYWKIKNALKFFESFLDEKEQCFVKDDFQEPHRWIQLFGDQLMWVYDVCCSIEKDRMLDFDVVYTTSPFHFTHLIGLYLHKKYNIPWVADFRDEWTYNPYKTYTMETNPYHRLHLLLEKKIVHAANCVVSISDLMKENYIKNFGMDDEKLHVITNGYDEDDFSDSFWKSKKNEKFTIVYTGLLYLKEQNLQPIFLALAQLIKANLIKNNCVEFKFIGDIATPMDFTGQVAEYCLEDVVTVEGYVTHSEAIQSCLQADMLICLIGDDATFKGVYTGKIFDYLRCGKPILAIAPHGGVVERLLQETGLGCSVESYESDKIEKFLLDEYKKWEIEEARQILKTDRIRSYERRYLTKQLAEIFCEVCNR